MAIDPAEIEEHVDETATLADGADLDPGLALVEGTTEDDPNPEPVTDSSDPNWVEPAPNVVPRGKE